jgi:hypothetical protein
MVLEVEAGILTGPACICVLLYPLALATVMEFAKYFYKETDETHRCKIKVTYKDEEDQEQERECCLDHIGGEVVVLAPHGQVSDLLPIGCLVVVGDRQT